MKIWLQYRDILLSITTVIVVLTLAVLIFNPEAGTRQVSTYKFPQTVVLPNWEFVESGDLPSAKSEAAKSWSATLAARKYIYQQKNQKLAIEMHYEVGTLGDLQTYIEKNTPINLKNNKESKNLEQKQEIGFYTVFTQQERSHLIACINPRGGSTINTSQFMHNRYAFDLQSERFLPWLLGQVSLLDRRCLWANLSLPVDQVASADLSPILETAWFDWYKWWSQNFPPH